MDNYAKGFSCATFLFLSLIIFVILIVADTHIPARIGLSCVAWMFTFMAGSLCGGDKEDINEHRRNH